MRLYNYAAIIIIYCTQFKQIILSCNITSKTVPMAAIYKKTLLLLTCFLWAVSALHADPGFETRRTAYINTALGNMNNDGLVIQAYKGLPVDPVLLNNILNSVATNQTSDFDVVKLIRILELSHGEYDSLILPVLRPIPFWLEKDETVREYWSENHMMQWMSSDWLLHEKYGKPIDSTLDKRLRHYLRLKIQYGYYEFFSSVYSPICLTGLINLADFAQDAEIKSLATQATQILLKDFMLLTNDKGTFFPTAGRNYPGKYETPYGQNHNSLIYLLTGLGATPGSSSLGGGFLATSSIDVDGVINTWRPILDTVYTQGHTLQDGINNINNTMSPKDKVIFQWSSGAYFDPQVAASTFQLIKDLNLWGHYEFADFRQFSFLPASLAPTVAEIASPISKSSGIYNPKISIFKNKSVTLSSIFDFWKGKVGYQEWPVVANAGTSAVYTLSGKPSVDWTERAESHINTHLPYVQQKDNVALVMYRPEKGLALFGYKDDKLDVELHWKTANFDEVREDGNWLLGREGNGYVAIRRHCVGEINGVPACDNPDGQTWIYMVGNSDMYGNFDNFEQKILQSQFETRWYFNLPTLQWVYYSKIVIDGKTLEYAWNGDILSGPTRTTGIRNTIADNNTLSVYPNPATNNIHLNLAALPNKPATITITNITGEVVYSENMDRINAADKIISSGEWSNGMYLISVICDASVYTQKVIIQK